MDATDAAASELAPERVRDVLADEAQGDPGPLSLRPLGGGASRQVLLIETLSGVDTRRWVLRRTPPGAESFIPLASEFRVLEEVAAAGVPVPRPVVFEPEGGRLGSAAYVMQYIDGETIAPRILRRDGFAAAREALPTQLAEALARIHSIPFAGLSILPRPDNSDPTLAACEFVEELIDRVGEPLPGVEASLRWLRLNSPEPRERRGLVHGDFRLGNIMVGPDGLRAVLDWELAHLGDPIEDIAWLALRSWRSGVDDKAVAGLSDLESFLDAYEGAGRPRPDARRLHWWSVMGSVKWAAICALQAYDHRTGTRPSHELASLGRRMAEPEWEALGLIAELADAAREAD